MRKNGDGKLGRRKIKDQNKEKTLFFLRIIKL